MIRVADVQRAVALEHGIDLAVMREPDAVGSRVRDHARPRQEAMRLAMLLTEHSTVRIGHFFGGRDHSTVLMASRRVAERCRTDSALSQRLRRLTLELLRLGLTAVDL